MAKFLTTVGNSFYIEQIILNAVNNLTLVTPYLNLSKNLIDRLTDADKRGIKITLIFGKNELKKSERNKIEFLKNIEIYYCQNLHAKCYLNEESLIITSMNLYEFSERNNREMGIFIEKSSDIQIFNDTLKEIESIKNSSVIQKTSKIKKKPNIISQLENKNDDRYIFHANLYEKLKVKYNNFNVAYDNECTITIENCPFKGINIKINGNVDFNILDDSFYTFLVRNYKVKMKDSLPTMRFFWNYCLKIYFEKNFVNKTNQEGLEQVFEKYSEIIDQTAKHITIANKTYT